MTHRLFRSAAVASFLLGIASAITAHARPTSLGSSFTYQGVLKTGGAAYSGTADFQFRLYDAASGPGQVGGMMPVFALIVTDGTFTTPLDFGALAFNGDDRWLEIDVRTPAGGAGSFTTLSPRQKLAAAPYALRALNASIAGAQPNQVSFSNASNAFSGSSLAIDGATLRVDAANHRVGVGTSLPQAALHVAESGGNQPSLLLSKQGDVTTSLSLVTPYRTWLIGQNVPPGGGQNDQFYIHDALAGATRLSIDTAGNVGIGTTNPTARLDVNGSLKASSIALAATARHYVVTAGDWTSVDTSTTPPIRAFGCELRYPPGASGNLNYRAPLHLPDGAVITELAAWFIDQDASSNVQVSICNNAMGELFMTPLVYAISAGSSANVQVVVAPTSIVVDNTNNQLNLTLGMPSSATALRAVRITYTVTSPLP